MGVHTRRPAALLVASLVAGLLLLLGCTSSAQKQAQPSVTLDTVSALPPPPPPPPKPGPVPKDDGQKARPPTGADGRGAVAFPWPPPQPSDLLLIPRRLLQARGVAPGTLADVNERLSDALSRAGYTGNRYYAVPEGFALVTRLERIDARAVPRPGDARWATGGLGGTPLVELLRGLFRGNPGRYRVFVFTVTSKAFAPDTAQATRAEAERWLRGGMNTLPADLASMPFSPACNVTALVYEFEQRHVDDVAGLLTPATVPAQTQLERARIWSALGG